ncbi:MAG: outer membrane protein assembly factor BamB family protein, partial [Alphaproteobacteria bacterium]
VYAMDGRGQVSAVGSDSAILWSLDTSPASEAGQDSSGGGVSYSNGVIYAATGFGEVLAIDAASGTIIWRRGFEAPIHSAPTVSGNRLYLVTRGDVAYSLRTDDGSMEWLQRGAVATLGGIEGGASPAVSGSNVILPFASGDILSAKDVNGQLNWREAMDGVRRSTALGFIGDISGDPVIDGNKLYVSTLAGQTVQMNLATGAKNWSLAAGATDAVWSVGGSVFLMSEQATLMRVNAGNGSVIWSQQLPAFENPEKRKGAIRYYGPILAGGLMWIAGRDGQLRGFAPENGAQVVTLNVPNGAAATPIVAGGIMYVLSLNGELHAFQ